jgi:hypothetical protein
MDIKTANRMHSSRYKKNSSPTNITINWELGGKKITCTQKLAQVVHQNSPKPPSYY